MIYVIFRFGFEGWIWVLIASVPDLCIRFTFKSKRHTKPGIHKGFLHVLTYLLSFFLFIFRSIFLCFFITLSKFGCCFFALIIQVKVYYHDRKCLVLFSVDVMWSLLSVLVSEFR